LTSILSAARRGEGAVGLPIHATSKIGRQAIARHVHACRQLHAPPKLELDDLFVRLRLPFERLHGGPPVCKTSFWHISKHAIAAAQQSAQRMGVTLNALFFATLAHCLHDCSGASRFSVSQTHYGRRFDEHQVVGSFSTSVPLEFDFSSEHSLRSTCRHVMSEVQRVMVMEYVFGGSQLPTVAWELNDVRPLPRPREAKGVAAPVVLTELFFTVNEFADGFAVAVGYNAGSYDDEDVERFVEEWMGTWQPSRMTE